MKSRQEQVKDAKDASVSRIDIATYLGEQFVHFSKSQRLLADYILKHMNEAVFMTAAELGQTVGVSESTVVRFASHLGYDGYPGFQKDLEGWVKGRLGFEGQMEEAYGKYSHSEVFESVLRADQERIEKTIRRLDPIAFDMAVQSILSAKRVFVIGLRSCKPLAEFLAFYLHSIRQDVVLLESTSTTEIFEQMIHIQQGDVLVGISFPRYSMRTLKAMEFAGDRNATVISITDSEHSPMNMFSTLHLLAASDMVSICDSLVAPLSVINALVVALCIQKPEQVRSSMQALEKAWNDYQVYLNDEINFIGDESMLRAPLKKEEK